MLIYVYMYFKELQWQRGQIVLGRLYKMWFPSPTMVFIYCNPYPKTPSSYRRKRNGNTNPST